MKQPLATLSCFIAAILVAAQENSADSRGEDAQVKAALESLPTIYETRTRVFSVLSENVEQMRRVAEIARKLEGHLSAILDWNLVADGAKLSIWIAPDENAGLLFETDSDFRRNATCTFFSDTKKLSDYAVAFGLAQTVLWQYGSEFKLGLKDLQAPLWAASAIATETAISHKSGRALLLRKKSEKMTPLPPKMLLFPRCTPRTSTLPDEKFQINAFWLYRSLRKRELASWQSFPMCFREILKNPQAAFPQKKDAPEGSDALAWATAFFSAIDKMPAGTESLEASRKRFEQSRRFNVQIGKTEKALDAGALIEIREFLGVRKLAYIRLRELNEMLSATNPVWHNAFVEFGIFLEMLVVREDTSGKLKEGASVWAPERGTRDKIEVEALNKQWEKVLAARQNAEQLHAEIRALLSEKEST